MQVRNITIQNRNRTVVFREKLETGPLSLIIFEHHIQNKITTKYIGNALNFQTAQSSFSNNIATFDPLIETLDKPITMQIFG